MRTKNWKTIGRPGYSGKKKAEIYAKYDSEYGDNNWRIAWQWGKEVLD